MNVFCNHVDRIKKPYEIINRRLIRINNNETPSYDLLMKKITKRFEDKINSKEIEIELFWEYSEELVGLSNDEISLVLRKVEPSIYFTTQMKESDPKKNVLKRETDNELDKENQFKAKKSKLSHNSPEIPKQIDSMDITNEIRSAIRQYAEEELSSPNNQFDLLQDEKQIKKIFGKNSNLLSYLSNKIGKIGITCTKAKTSKNEFVVRQLFDLNNQEKIDSDFHQIFLNAFNKREQKYESEITCIAENYPLYIRPIKEYILVAGYDSNLQVLSDKSQNDSDKTTHNESTNNILQKYSTFIDQDLSKYQTFGSLRPDHRIQDEHGRIFTRVEVKADQLSLETAKKELVLKCFQINRFQYGEIKIQFGLAVAGNKAQLYLISFKPECEIKCNKVDCLHSTVKKTNLNALIKLHEYDLTDVCDRILLIFNAMVLTEISQQMRRKFPPLEEFYKFKHDDIVPRTRNNKLYAQISFSYLLNMVEKIVFIEDEISSKDLLKLFYDLIPSNGVRKETNQKGRSKKKPQKDELMAITDTVKIVYYNMRSTYKLWIEPIGYNFEWTIYQVCGDIKEFQKAVICVMEAALSMHANGFVHRDIRWHNITFDPERNTYLLFDFEQIGKLCKLDCQEKAHNKFYCTPAIIDAAFIIKLFGHPALNFEQYQEYAIFANNLEPYEIVKNCCEEKILKVKNLFWEFYEENIENVKGLDSKDIENRKKISKF